MNAMDRINVVLAMPKTHRATVTYQNGRTRAYDAHCEASARNFADREASKIGRDLLDRDTGATVRIVSVSVTRIGA